MLVVFFFDPADESSRRFETETLGDAAVVQRLKKDYVCLRLPLDAQVSVEHDDVTLLKHAAFEEMLRRPGIAILDFAHAEAELHGYVVSAFPLTSSLQYTPTQMGVILDLPPGTLTQRTLIYAVRIHPECPGSASGQFEGHLAEEAQSHSENQARMRLQGHHAWETRFHRINCILPAGLTAREVCAESWPGQGLVEAAIECVRCWRCSDGHWSAVRRTSSRVRLRHETRFQRHLVRHRHLRLSVRIAGARYAGCHCWLVQQCRTAARGNTAGQASSGTQRSAYSTARWTKRRSK